MCDLFSWVKKADGTVLFLRDSDIEARWDPSDENFREYIGHSSIKEYHKESFEEHLEDIYTIPKELAEAVNRGECRRMLQSVGYKTLEYKIGKKDGKLCKVDGMTREERIVKVNSLNSSARTPNNLSSVRVGSKVVLGEHKPFFITLNTENWARVNAHEEYINWVPEMNAFVGRKTTITRIKIDPDGRGCFWAFVKADKGEWMWRIQDMQVVKY